MKPDKSQQEAINSISKGIINKTHKIQLLIGRGGFGKSYTVSHIVKELLSSGKINPEGIYFCGPTGKSADVLQNEIAHLNLPNEAMTIHRMLGCRGVDWEYNNENPLDAEVVFADEQSMVGSSLLARLLSSVATAASFVLVGDSAQLFPVSAGCPFADIVSTDNKEIIHELKVCHRQKQGSLIADAAESVRHGNKIKYGATGEYTLGGTREDDLFLCAVDDNDNDNRHPVILDEIVDIIKPWFDNDDDFVVICPQHGGPIGVTEINKHIQLELNSDAAGVPVGDSFFGLGDLIRQTKNNYELGVFNGMIGRVTSIGGGGVLTARFGNKEIVYTEMKQLFDITLGFCVSIHASQGSGYDKGIIVADRSHSFMWSRSLLYVAITRFKKKCYIIGQKTVVARAIRNDKKDARMTYLGDVLNQEETR